MIDHPVPDVVLKTRVRDESIGGDNPFRWQDRSTGEIFGNGRHVLFALPGAFTPTCSNEQCPAFEREYEALKAAGATQTSQILYGYWPAVKPAYWSIMLLRWDINIRESSVLGLVGAGGLGMIMNAAIDTFQWDRVAVILLTIFAVVVIGEVVVTFFRRRLI